MYVITSTTNNNVIMSMTKKVSGLVISLDSPLA